MTEDHGQKQLLSYGKDNASARAPRITCSVCGRVTSVMVDLIPSIPGVGKKGSDWRCKDHGFQYERTKHAPVVLPEPPQPPLMTLRNIAPKIMPPIPLESLRIGNYIEYQGRESGRVKNGGVRMGKISKLSRSRITVKDALGVRHVISMDDVIRTYKRKRYYPISENLKIFRKTGLVGVVT